MTSDSAIAQRLEVARRELLDLTGRNRLLNTQRKASRSTRLEIVDEISQEVFRHLVVERKTMSFLDYVESVEADEPETAKSESDEPQTEELPPDQDTEDSNAATSKDDSEKDSAPTHQNSETETQLDTEAASQQQPTDVESDEKTQSAGLPPSDEATQPIVSLVESTDDSDAVFETDSGPVHRRPEFDTMLGTPEVQEDEIDEHALPQPEDDEPDARHIDDKLQTSLTSEKLQKRLLKMYYDARTFEEEQGVNILFAAIGFLKWTEPDKPETERYAPLILVPVSLSRRSAGSKFRVRYNEEEIITNLSLQEKLKVEFDLTIPAISDDDDWTPDDYFAEVEAVIQDVDGWEVLRNDIVMWFFSFSKFLMYRDLQTENWPANKSIEQHPLVQSLLTSGFQSQPPILEEGEHLDRVLDPLTTIHVTDADSSQSVAIEEIRQGRNLVIQGPPGTGKSQTITNLIGAAVKEGRKVLFVAEKMAALEVVKRRLDALGIGITCLELHSHKASKRSVLRELDETLRLGRPNVGDVEGLADELRSVRDELNQHAESMCTELEPSSVTPFQAIGELVRLRKKELAPPIFNLPAALDWDANAFKERVGALQDLVDHLANIGNPKLHTWRGVQLGTILPTDQNRIQTASRELLESFNRLRAAVRSLCEPLKTTQALNQTEVEALVSLAKILAAMPDLDRDALMADEWQTKRNQIVELVDSGKELESIETQLEGVFAELAWDEDVREIRMAINSHGESFFLLRWINGDYRQAISRFKGLLAGPNPGSTSERVALLDKLMSGQKIRQQIIADDERGRIGQRAFGKHWRATSSDWDQLQGICDWEAACQTAVVSQSPTDQDADHRALAVSISDASQLTGLADQVVQQLNSWQADFEQFCELVQLNTADAFVQPLNDESFGNLLSKFTGWANDIESITHWIDYRRRWQNLGELSLIELAAEIHAGRLPADEVIDQFDLKYYDEMTRAAFERFPHLAEFNGTTHENLLASFAQLDRDRMLLARREVARVHYDGMPVNAANIGQVGIVRREIQKKRRHLALRRLLRDAGRAVQAIKPVFMMSPTSIAQFLEPGRLHFDLLVIDEASQVPPVDALGAIARADQIVVVGDDKQLPPTRFFQRTSDDDGSEAENHDEFQAGNMESILSLCAAQNVSQRMLRWHYRSRHHSLIEVSNKEFYNEQLYVIPSPEKNSPELGLKHRFVENGVFDRGASATNQIEASAVVDAVLEHVQSCPSRTLGVGTFSVSQRDAVLDELERRRREHPEFESFFSSDSYEPFFVKNLENIQGDERDVIFISVGYAKDDNGKLTMNFGPLNNEGGERRLNVLITRARSRCEVFASFRSTDIDLNRTNARGTESLKTFLRHAERNSNPIETSKQEVAASSYSEQFESEVASQLSERGYLVEQHVGTTGLFVDVAIEDPAEDDRFFMGIECDGPDYQSARTARDRDRIRFDVLKRQGWNIDRVWSIDWLHRPQEQLQRLIDRATSISPPIGNDVETLSEADEKSAAETRTDSQSEDGDPTDDQIDEQAEDAGETQTNTKSETPDASKFGDEIERSEQAANFVNPCGVIDYVVADFSVEASDAVHELPSKKIQNTILRVVKIEGPVHLDEVSRRVASLYGLKRTSSRVTETVQSHVAEMAAAATIHQTDEFVSIVDAPVRIRDRSKVTHLRKTELIALSEIRVGVQAIIEAHFGATQEDAIIETGRLFGFSATSSQLRERIAGQVEAMLDSEMLVEMDSWLHVNEQADVELES